MAENKFQEDLDIDPVALDIEWLNQPQRFMKYSQEMAELKKELDLLKQKLKVLESKLILRANENGKVLFDAKPTVAMVDSWVKTQEEHIDLTEQIIEKEYELNLLSNAVTAFNQRKSSLENLVKLFLADYFSGPKEPRDFTKTEIIHEKVKPKRRNKNA